MKTCTKCGESKPLSRFRATGGWCMDCHNAYNRSRYTSGSRKTLDHARWQKKRETAIQAHGGRCLCCRETQFAFLRVLKKEVWCFNCSEAVRRVGKCPHRTAKAAGA